MSEQWKPGDVALADRGPSWRGRVLLTSRGWVDQGGDFDGVEPLFPVSNLRRLVVIDPEDAEQVERLARAYIATWVDGCKSTESTEGIAARQIRAALREFANPTPRIEEPKGLGAVVEAIYDNRFVHLGGGQWQRVTDAENHPPCEWAAIAVVRVLSLGVEDQP